MCRDRKLLMICFAPVCPDRTHNSLTQVHKNHGRREKSAGRHVRISEKRQKKRNI